jgi:hypothetical protein
MNDSSTDINKLIEQAMSMSKIIGIDTNNFNHTNKDLNMEELMKTFQMLQSLQGASSYGDSDTYANKDYGYSSYNMLELYPNLKAVQSAIPFLEVNQQRTLNIIIKFLEIKQLEKTYKNIESTSSVYKNPNWKYDMIKAMKPHLNDSKKNNIDMLLNIIEMKSMLKNLETINKN